MDWNRIEGNWKQMTGNIQERYGSTKDAVRQELDNWSTKQPWYSIQIA